MTSRRPSKRSLFRRDGSPCAALEAVMVGCGCDSLEDIEQSIRHGELTLEIVLSCRHGGSRFAPGIVARYLFRQDGSPRKVRRRVPKLTGEVFTSFRAFKRRYWPEADKPIPSALIVVPRPSVGT